MSWSICPASDYISQPYGCTDFPGEWLVDVNTCPSRHFHAGVDLGHSQGGWIIYRTPVFATRAGIVVAVGTQYLGPYAVTVHDVLGGVWIEHGHLDEASVVAGQLVSVGDQLGLVGTQGASTAPHLHVEVRIDGPRQGNPDRYTIDPTPYLTGDDVTAKELQDALRAVLDEGTAAGQGSWAGTSIDTAHKVDVLFHQLAEAVAMGQSDAKGTVIDTHDKVDKLYHAVTDPNGAVATLAAVKTTLDAIKASGVGADPGVKTILDLLNRHFK